MDEQLTTNSPISQFENAVNANDIENPAPQLNLPQDGQFQSTFSPMDITEFLQPSQTEQSLQQTVTTGQQQSSGLLSRLAEQFNKLAARGATQTALEEQAGIPELNTQLTDAQNELQAIQLRARRQEEALLTEAGLTEGQRNARLRDVQRKNRMEEADQQIIVSALSNQLTNAQSLINKKVELQFADEQARLDGLKFIYGENKEQLTDAQNKLWQSTLNREQRQFDLAKDEYQRFSASQIEAVKNAQLSGAGNGVMSMIMSKGSMQELLQDPNTAKYLVSPKEKLELQKLNIDIASSNMEYQKLVQEMAQAKAYLNGTTGDPTLDIISASAQYGDKRLTDSQLEKIQQATNALGSMESLQGLLMQGKDGIDLTGPLKGRARNLAAQLGGDADAKAINATIQGLIPTVARGIFGEVGVLTDQDIANYRKTVPNLTSTEAQNQLVSLVMYDVLSRSLKTTLVTNAQNQTNVSNFATTYIDAQNRIDTLKAELGVVETAPIDEGNRVKMESSWNSLGVTQNQATDALNSFLSL